MDHGSPGIYLRKEEGGEAIVGLITLQRGGMTGEYLVLLCGAGGGEGQGGAAGAAERERKQSASLVLRGGRSLEVMSRERDW